MEKQHGKDPTEVTFIPHSTSSRTSKEAKMNENYCLRIVALLSTIIALVLGISLIITGIQNHNKRAIKCETSTDPTRDFKNPDFLDDLTPTEMENVRDYLYRQKSLNIKKITARDINGTYIYTMTLFQYPKKTVLDYLDGRIRAPKRKSKVVLFRGDVAPPRVEEYIVGPVDNPDSHELYKNPIYRQYPIPFTSRPFDEIEYYSVHEFANKTLEYLYPVLLGSYGSSYHNCTGENCVTVSEVTPPNFSPDSRMIWMMTSRKVEGYYITPLGLDFLVDHKSINPKDWSVQMLLYNGQIFSSPKELLQKYLSGEISRIIVSKLDLKNLYSSFKQNPHSTASPQAGPRLIEPAGRRFTVKNQQVEYMNWSFKFGTDVAKGIRLTDVRFKNERLAFEIVQSETCVFYSAYHPVVYTSVYFDSSWLLGLNSKQLTRGVDCPDTAVYLDSYFFMSDKPIRVKNAICIFENNPGIPLRRHYTVTQSDDTIYGGIIDYHLVFRSIAVIWNYDYIFDFKFHQNGQLDVVVSSTGYVMSAFSHPTKRKYSNPIADNVMAMLHQHLFHYKVDLDIGGLKNRFSSLDIRTETLSRPEFHPNNKTQAYVVETLRRTERDAAIKYNFNEPKYYAFYKKGDKNKYGSDRAYRISNQGMSKFLFPQTSIYKGASWAQYQIAVTKQKDAEESSSSMFHQFNMLDPIVSFDDFLKDDEPIVDEDLVAWVTMGIHHMPSTEDVPSTTTSGTQLFFSLKPYNYFDECPSRLSSDNIHIGVGDDNQATIDTSKTVLNFTCTPQYVGFSNYVPDV